MIIAFDAKRAFQNRTGLGEYSRGLISGLVHQYPEHHYHLLGPALNRDVWDPARLLAGHVYLHLSPPGTGALWRTWLSGIHAGRIGAQVFHGLSHELPTGLPAKVRKVVTMHDLLFRQFPEDYPLADRIIYDYKFRSACKRADTIIAISEATRLSLIDTYRIDPSRIKVIYQGCRAVFYQREDTIDRDLRLSKMNISTPYLLSVGSVIRRKNLHQVVQALAMLPPDLRIPLVVVGRGKSYLREVLTLAAQLGIESLIRQVQPVDDQDLAALYQASSALVYMSRAEGFGIPVLEALASGTPVLTSSRSSLPEAGGEGALYADPDDPAHIRDGLARLLTDTDFCGALRIGAQAHLHRFRPEKLSAQLMEVYEQAGTYS
ncbi:MAG: glycosyltransferase family 1 protein [Bacteroidia bacterium]|nr:glycosyltransferase family 1 protein [Bacteroidia bacterium]